MSRASTRQSARALWVLCAMGGPVVCRVERCAPGRAAVCRVRLLRFDLCVSNARAGGAGWRRHAVLHSEMRICYFLLKALLACYARQICAAGRARQRARSLPAKRHASDRISHRGDRGPRRAHPPPLSTRLGHYSAVHRFTSTRARSASVGGQHSGKAPPCTSHSRFTCS